MIPFVKAEACGNDFLIVEEQDAAGDHAEIARQLCSRHFGVGADGVEFLQRQADGSLGLRLFNADGSEAELSGNGTRCVAAFLAWHDGVLEPVFQTTAGPRACSVLSQEETGFVVRSAMGVPQIKELTVDAGPTGMVTGALVDVGNPHFVLFTKDPDFRCYAHPWQVLGAMLCTHPAFPNGTNVEFVRVLSPDEVEFRIFERGVGPTNSSGTGTCASAAAAIATQQCSRNLTVNSLGGAQQAAWPEDDQQMFLTGPAKIICMGEAAFDFTAPAATEVNA